MPTVAQIRIHPFKSLDPQGVSQAVLLPSGALEHDRRFALVDERGDYINAKRTPAIQLLRSHFDPASGRLMLRVEGSSDSQEFDVVSQRDALCEWLGHYFDTTVTLLENTDGGFPDDVDSPGPTLISTATLAVVAGWFGGWSLDEARDRFRANLEIDGVEPFWEDRLLAAGIGAVRFRIGETELLGTNPCARCIVPSRHPRSAEPLHGFAKTFAQHRREELPEWAPTDRFDHFYRLSVNTRPAAGAPRRCAWETKCESSAWSKRGSTRSGRPIGGPSRRKAAAETLPTRPGCAWGEMAAVAPA